MTSKTYDGKTYTYDIVSDVLTVDGKAVQFSDGDGAFVWAVVTGKTPNSSEFYADVQDRLFTVMVDGFEFAVYCTGIMDIHTENHRIRSAYDFEAMGITDDKQLGDFMCRDDVEVANNPWLEVWALDDEGVFYEDPEIAHCITDAVECVLDLAKDLVRSGK